LEPGSLGRSARRIPADFDSLDYISRCRARREGQ
jgi:hypothetical protein